MIYGNYKEGGSKNESRKTKHTRFTQQQPKKLSDESNSDKERGEGMKQGMLMSATALKDETGKNKNNSINE